jgi:hypothetical protein
VSKRHQIFISSTYTDLRHERQAVIMALLQLDAIPAGMELFPAADDDAWTLIKKVILECDYYLLLIGGKYGSVDAEGVGFTEREYDYAVSIGKPVMAFLHGDPDGIELGKSEKGDEARAKLEGFRSKVQHSKHVKYWTSAEHLAGQVALSYSHFLKAYPTPGWLRADDAASPEAIVELNTLRKENFELKASLETAQAKPPPGSEDLEQGGDTFDFVIDADFRLTGDDITAPVQQNHWLEVEPTWDEILSGIGSRLLDECAEVDMREALVSSVIARYEPDLDEEVLNTLAEEGHDVDGWVPVDYEGDITDEVWGTILVQLTALGLITKSTRSRSVKDRNTYWTLKPYGQSRVVQLMAIRRAVSGADNS